MVPFQKMVKIPQQNGTILGSKGSKLLNKNGTISEKDQKSSTKMVPFQKMVKIPQKNGTILGSKGSNYSTKMVPFQKMVENPQQKWYHFRTGSKILDKNGTISEECQKSSTKMVQFQKRVKNRQPKWYHFCQKMVENPQQKWYHFRTGSKILDKNGTISEECQKSSTKMIQFQKRVKNRQPKWYHFCQKMVKIPQQKWYRFRKGSKILNKNGTMRHDKKRRQDLHIMLLPWDKG